MTQFLCGERGMMWSDIFGYHYISRQATRKVGIHTTLSDSTRGKYHETFNATTCFDLPHSLHSRL
jgi:hypothetical protein